jgi:hypothetical protein
MQLLGRYFKGVQLEGCLTLEETSERLSVAPADLQAICTAAKRMAFTRIADSDRLPPLNWSDFERATERVRGDDEEQKGLEVTMPRRVRELLLKCIDGKAPEECLFTRANGTPVRDFRRSWRKACTEAGVPGLHFHDLRRTAARNMRPGHISEQVAMEIGGWKTTSVFHRYAIVDNQDIARVMDMLEISQDQHRQEWNERSPPSVAGR